MRKRKQAVKLLGEDGRILRWISQRQAAELFDEGRADGAVINSRRGKKNILVSVQLVSGAPIYRSRTSLQGKTLESLAVASHAALVQGGLTRTEHQPAKAATWVNSIRR